MEIEQLVKACQKGDRQAFEELIRLFYPYVSGFLLKLTPDASLAEDLTQETFLKMIRGIDRFDTRRGAGFGTWLVTIARNLYIDAVRRRVPSAELEALPLRDPTDMAAAVDQRLQYEEVLQAMEELPPRAGAGHPAEIRGKPDAGRNRGTLRRTAQHREKPHPRRRCQAAAAIPFDRKDGAR